MAEFELTVEYQRQEYYLPAKLMAEGFTHKIAVDVFGTEVLFEPDEENNYRAVVDPVASKKLLDGKLLKAIAEQIESMIS